jgi:glycosyltransferase involved in cell wall biosynthesis
MIDWKRQCAAVIPCYNEAGRIGQVVGDVRQYLDRVIVVDDGSRDGTAKEAATAGANVLRQLVNSGKGTGLRRGWSKAHELGFAWALTMDGDGQHAAADIPEFFSRAERTEARLVIGNRMPGADAMPRVRRWTNRLMSRCLSNLTGAHLPDSQCGFRLVHLQTALQLPISSTRFEIESETLVAFLTAGECVEFVPIQVRYESSSSNICPVRDTWRWVRWWTAQQPAL